MKSANSPCATTSEGSARGGLVGEGRKGEEGEKQGFGVEEQLSDAGCGEVEREEDKEEEEGEEGEDGGREMTEVVKGEAGLWEVVVSSRPKAGQ